MLNALHSREIDGFGFVPFDNNIFLDKERKDTAVLKLLLPQYQALFFNYRNKNLADTRLRSALNELIPRAKLAEKALNNNGQGTISPFDFYLNKPVANLPGSNLEKAKSLFEAAGWKK